MKRAYILLHLSIFLWGFTGIFGRAIDLHEVVLVFYRLVITVPAIFIIGIVSKKIKLISLKEFLPLLLVGLLIAIHWVCFYGSIKYSNISVGLSCLSLNAVFSAVLEPIINRSKFKIAELILAAVSAFGMYLIYHFEGFYSTGITLGIISSLFAALFTVLNKKQSSRHHSLSVSFYELTSAFVFISIALPFYIYFFNPEKIVPSGNEWMMLFVFSIVCTVLPFNMALISLRKISAYMANLSINLEPVYGIFFAFILFNEQKELNAGFFAGSAILISSVVFYMFWKFRARNKIITPL